MKPNVKIFLVLALLSVFAAVLILPYIQALTGDLLEEAQAQLGLQGSLFSLVIIIQSAVMYVAAALIGVLIYRKAGFRLPLLEKYVAKEEVSLNLRSWLLISFGGGILVGVLVICGDYLFLKLGSPLSLLESELPSWWKGLLGAYSAGVGEEILFRLLIMTVLTLLFHKLLRLPRSVAVWIAIAIAALLFGLMHIPATLALVQLTPLVLVRALLLNAIGAVVFGWLYWKKGLESAIIAHFTADVMIHGLLQLL